MKAYLETVVISRKPGGDVNVSCSQIMLEFDSQENYINFKNSLKYQKGEFYEIIRTLLPMN